MVLYHASTMYHLLCCIVHNMAFNEGEQSQLLMTEYMRPLNERKSFAEKLLKYGFFTKVRYVPEKQIKMKKGITLDENSSEQDINTVINNICNAFGSWFGEDMHSYDKIYVASDQHSCGIYLMQNKIPYSYFEDASGMLSEKDRYLRIIQAGNMTNHIINEYLGGAGRNDAVIAKLCDLQHQSEGFYDEKAVDFSIYNILKNIIPHRVPDLLSFFGDTKETIKSDKRICLFLTQDLNTLELKDIDYQELMMTTLVDYVCSDHMLVIKPHPKDRWQNYSRIFPNAYILPRGVPSELLPFAIESRIDIALTASSTSIRGVSEFVDKSYYFTTEIETNREALDYMYVAVQVLKNLGVSCGVAMQNINTTQMNNLLDSNGIPADGDYILIDGGLTTENDNITENGLTLYLSTGKSLNLPKNSGMENTFLISADFIPEYDSIMKEKTYYIFAVCKDENIKAELENFYVRKNLKYTLASVEISACKFNDEIKNRMLSLA